MEIVSIVIPVFNTEKILLENCILSALNQKNCAVEVILVDDGSDRKETVNSCIKYENNYNNVRLIRQNNQGPSAARNNGIQAAIGKYIMFLDSDDCLIPDSVSYLYGVLNKSNCDIVEGAVEEAATNVPSQVNYVEEVLCRYSGRDNLLQLAVDGCQAPLTWSLWGKLFKTDIMKKSYNMYLDINRGEDLLSLTEYIVNTQSFIHSNRYVYCYNRGNVLSITNTKNNKVDLSLCLAWEKISNICKSYGHKETYLKAKANYCGCVFGALIQCCKSENEKEKEIYIRLRKMMYQNKWQYLFNRYISRRGKCIIALLFPKLFAIKRIVKNGTRRR